jgi:hypothetical protein
MVNFEGRNVDEGRIERLSFTPPTEILTLGTPKRFTLVGKPGHSVLRPQRLMSNSPCRGFVSITRLKFGEQIHFEAPAGHADSFDLKAISEVIMDHGGFHTLSAAAGVEIDCVYSGERSVITAETYNWMMSILGPGILVVAL